MESSPGGSSGPGEGEGGGNISWQWMDHGFQKEGKIHMILILQNPHNYIMSV